MSDSLDAAQKPSAEGSQKTSPKVLDGKALAAASEAEMAKRVEALKAKNGGRTPILATILVGEDPASATYVKMKGNACRRVGMDSRKVELSAETTTEQLLAAIDDLNADPDVHGILLQHRCRNKSTSGRHSTASP